MDASSTLLFRLAALPFRRVPAAAALGLATGLAAGLALAPAPAAAFSIEDVTARAQALSREEYRDHRQEVPKWMLVEPKGSMTYDQWRDIRFNPQKSLWKAEGLPFQVQFFHPGLYYERSVGIHVVENGNARPVPFDSRTFDYGKNTFASKIPRDIGYAGVRIHAPLRTKEYFDELAVFLGASYFRALGRDTVYGLSARGLAINTVDPSGEEFPHFVEFWLEKPAAGATSLVVYALMESPSITGSYRFEIHPGEKTSLDVESHLFPRRPIAKLGVAPLTSMFWFGENSRRRFDDFRPEVHDSDGLLVKFDSGEWLWRPLDNFPRINASGMATRNPRGFGLIQRDRDFANYQDLETRSELRPSAWVEPKGDWGEGRVELDEIPTDNELLDNMVAYWVPRQAVQPGQKLDFAYRLTFFMDDDALPPGGRVLSTRQDSGPKHDVRRFVVDFGGKELDALANEAAPEAVISTSPAGSAELLDHHVVRNPGTGGWRLSFQVKPKSKDPIELRAFLKTKKGAMTETWSYPILQ